MPWRTLPGLALAVISLLAVVPERQTPVPSTSRLSENGAALAEAIRSHDLDSVRRLARVQAVLKEPVTSRGYSALSLAVKEGNAIIIRVLLAAGADVNMRDANRGENGETPLGHAIERDDFLVAKLLLDAGADPNLRFAGSTPLGYAAYLGAGNSVLALLRQGAVVDVRSPQLLEEGREKIQLTPLMVAACMSHDAVVRTLLEHNADPLLTTADGETALTLAGRCSNPLQSTLSALRKALQK